MSQVDLKNVITVIATIITYIEQSFYETITQ